MSLVDFQDRCVLVAGPGLAALAREAMPGARLEIAPTDRMGALASIHAAVELVLIEAEAVDPSALRAALETLAARSRPPAVLLAGDRLPGALVRALMKIDRSDVLDLPLTAPELARAAGALLAEAPPVAAAPVNAHCWSVIGAVGGAGATTIAVELATTLARRCGEDRRVALVDLNLADGAAAAYLGATPAMLLAEASSAPDRIDQALLNAFSMRVGDGLDLLAAPRDPKAFARVNQTAVCRMLEVACQVYDWIVIDLPRQQQPWTLDVLAGSDEVLIVSELTVPALLSARALAAEIEADLPGGRQPRIILNRLATRVFGPSPSLAEAEKALQRKADGGITSDWEAAAASVNLGGSITHHRPRSKIVRDIGVIVDRLTEAARVEHARSA